MENSETYNIRTTLSINQLDLKFTEHYSEQEQSTHLFKVHTVQ